MASIDFTKSIEIDEIRNVKAIVQIQNAINFQSKISIRGTLGFKFDDVQGLERMLNIKRIHPRSFRLLCTLNNNNVKWKKVLYEFGSRTGNDVMLHLQREFIDTKDLTSKAKPKFTFSFQDERINISYVSITADVSVNIRIKL